jgi:hypothetical protein
VIDASAALWLLGALTGIVMWLALPRRRRFGMMALAASVVICGVISLVLVP